MDDFCTHHFATFQSERRLREKQKKLRAQQQVLRKTLLDSMKSHGHKNVQIAGEGDARHQIKLSRYYVPKQLTREALDDAKIDWTGAASQSFDDQIHHIVEEVKKLMRDGRPFVDVKPCGKRSRERLPLVGGGALSGGGTRTNGNNGGRGSTDPFTSTACQLATLKEEMRGVATNLKNMRNTPETKSIEATALRYMIENHAKKRCINIRHKGEVTKFIIRRVSENRRPNLTIKSLKACVKQALEEQHSTGQLRPGVFKTRLYELTVAATVPIKKETIKFDTIVTSDAVGQALR
jgi:hypothetical protein